MKDTVQDLKKNQQRILTRLGAIEDVIEDLKCARNDTHLQPENLSQSYLDEYSPSSSPEHSPLPSPEKCPPLPEVRSPSPCWSPSPPPLPPPHQYPIRDGQFYPKRGCYPQYSPQSYWYPETADHYTWNSIPQYSSSLNACHPYQPPQPSPQAMTSPVESNVSFTAGHAPACASIVPRRNAETLNSTEIEKKKLTDPQTVIAKYSKYRTVS